MFNRVLKMALDSAEWAIPEKIQTAEVEDILSEKKKNSGIFRFVT